MKRDRLINAIVIILMTSAVLVSCNNSNKSISGEAEAALNEIAENVSEAVIVVEAPNPEMELVKFFENIKNNGEFNEYELKSLLIDIDPAVFTRFYERADEYSRLFALHYLPYEVLANSINLMRPSSNRDFAYNLSSDGNGIVITKYTGMGGVVIVPDKIEDYPVTAIDARAFAKSYYWENWWLDSSGYYEGNDSVILAIILPDTVETIYGSAFREQSDLHTINLPANLKSIEYTNPFQGCTELYNIIIPETLTAVSGADYLIAASQKLPLRTRAKLQELADAAAAAR